MNKKILMMFEAYKEEIAEEIELASFITRNIRECSDSVIDDVYNSAIIKMCIKYESFTGDLYEKIITKKNISYNHPWSYTRKIAEFLKIDISNEYEKAHNSWDIYNTLKHINSKTKILSIKMLKKHNLKSSKETAAFICKSLIDLIEKIEKGINFPKIKIKYSKYSN